MANNYDREALNELCGQIDLLEYASKSMDFEKRGSDSYATHCPLHIDKTPSLFITPKKNMFYCFSCGVGGNLINWLMVFENMKFDDAIKKVGELSGADISNLRQCETLKIFKTLKKMKNKVASGSVDRVILPDNEILKYSDEIPKEWVDEGIKPEIMKKFQIRIDEKTNRIVYPIYDNNFKLIGIKGRTRYKNYKLLKIQKYMNYFKIGKSDFFVGMKENWESIQKHDEVIIFEGIKSVMKAYGWGYDYCVASETSWLSEDQVKVLISRKIKDVVIAFDNDVEFKKIEECTKNLRRFANVYVIRDRTKLLGNKEDKLSPCDKGRDVWEMLYSKKERI